MNLSKFFFKLVIALAYILGLMLIILPVAWIIVYAKEEGWRYGFTFIKNNFEVALFVSFAIGFMISVYHALKFEVIGESPLRNYLKSTQVVKVKGEKGIEMLFSELQKDDHFWFDKIEQNGDSIVGRANVFYNYTYGVWFGKWIRRSARITLLSPDRIKIRKDDDYFVIESRPFSKIWFIDFGRNFANVTEIAKAIKGIK